MKALYSAILIAVVLLGVIGADYKHTEDKRRVEFGHAYGECKYDMEKWWDDRWTADAKQDEKRRTDRVFLCLSSKGFAEQESAIYLHGRQTPMLM